MTNFLAELSFSDISNAPEVTPNPLNKEIWTMMIDGAVNSKGVGVDITITSPTAYYERARNIKLDYPLSNN